MSDLLLNVFSGLLILVTVIFSSRISRCFRNARLAFCLHSKRGAGVAVSTVVPTGFRGPASATCRARSCSFRLVFRYVRESDDRAGHSVWAKNYFRHFRVIASSRHKSRAIHHPSVRSGGF